MKKSLLFRLKPFLNYFITLQSLQTFTSDFIKHINKYLINTDLGIFVPKLVAIPMQQKINHKEILIHG